MTCVGEGSGWTEATTGSSGTTRVSLFQVSPCAELEWRLRVTDSHGPSDSEIITIDV